MQYDFNERKRHDNEKGSVEKSWDTGGSSEKCWDTGGSGEK